MNASDPGPRPAEICRGLLEALDASDGRRKRRKRDTKPDSIGLAIKRTILEEAIRDDPAPEQFEAWLLDRCVRAGAAARTPLERAAESSGSFQAMARMILEEWRLATASGVFRTWLTTGAPSDDRVSRSDDAGARCPGPPPGRPG